MPNGGSDCCWTCCFNAKNKGEAGYAHTDDPEPSHCVIRDFRINDATGTYCANHPHHNPQRLDLPIGPVFVSDVADPNDARESPDTPAIRDKLLELLNMIPETPARQYRSNMPSFDDVIIIQLGMFRERRAIPGLQRILAFNLDAIAPELRPYREYTVAMARVSLEKLGASEAGSA